MDVFFSISSEVVVFDIKFKECSSRMTREDEAETSLKCQKSGGKQDFSCFDKKNVWYREI